MVAAVVGCSPAALLNELVPRDGYEVRAGVAYGPNERQSLDLYVPEGAAEAPRPIVVFFYGGSWKDGDRGLYRFIGEAFTRLGYVVAVPDYTVYPEGRFPTFMKDAARAAAWVRNHAESFGGDPDRIVLAGHSAGAHMAMLLVFDDRYLAEAGVPKTALRSAIGLAGPYAINPLAYESIRPVFAGIASPDVARPIAFANGDAPPLLLLHGTDDSTVNAKNSRFMAEAVRRAGGRVDIVEYDDVGHIGLVVSLSAPFRGRDTVYEDVAAFLRRSLDPRPALVPVDLGDH